MLTSRLLLWAALVAAVLAVLGAGALYVRSATKAKADLAAAEESNRISQDALLQWQAAAQRHQADLDALRVVQERAAAETRRLNKLFAKHSLGRLALAKPGLVEARVNRGTARMLELLQCASQPGCAPPTSTSSAAASRSDPDAADPVEDP